MNKFMQKLALALINRRLRKMERDAVGKLKKLSYGDKRTTTMIDVMEDPQEYLRLRYLRSNIQDIHDPWQGLFSPGWVRWPKDKSKIKKFPELEPRTEPEYELSPEDQEWADLPLHEFLERLNAEYKEVSN